ncbi:MAG: enoyl-CoA hydratase/isomerase family protein [Actinobacteria bacterium]|nr:enoyl-CoA hydratase/isomerase family protein [Actinomycetota bacterium]
MSIDVHIDGAVAVVTMNRPERKNAFTREQYDALGSALARIDADDTLRVAVLTGVGAAFSSGQDLKEMAEMATAVASGDSVAGGSTGVGGFTVLLDALESFGKPLIAAVNGVAVGIGMTLLPYCDIVLMARSARMRVPFSELGVPPEAASSVLFADRVGWQRAAELLLTSRWIDADEAVAIGMALRVEDDEALMGSTMTLAHDIASKSAYSTRVIKRLMVAGRGDRTREARTREEALFAALFRSGEFGH